MSGTDYYATKAKSQEIFVVVTIIIVLALIYLGNEIREILRYCSYKYADGKKDDRCNKMEILGYSVVIIYLIFVAIMHIQKYRKEKAFDDHIKEKKKTNDELKVIDDENKAFSKKVNMISIPFYIFLVIAVIVIVIGIILAG